MLGHALEVRKPVSRAVVTQLASARLSEQEVSGSIFCHLTSVSTFL